jgi:hypothetical protein
MPALAFEVVVVSALSVSSRSQWSQATEEKNHPTAQTLGMWVRIAFVDVGISAFFLCFC